MKTEIKARPVFSHIVATLSPGEGLTTESGAMASMDAKLEMKSRTNGDFLSAFLKKFLGKESFFVSDYKNNTSKEQTLVITQPTPGDILEIPLNNETLYLQKGAYIASSGNIRLSVKWAGFRCFLAGEGLFKLVASGKGILWIGAYGAMKEQEIDGHFLVDSGHLVAWDPELKFTIQMAGGLFASILSKEGFVTRLSGKGKVILQTRNIEALVKSVNRLY